eukprot:7225784-Pyramimonas_sp.AAC.1
MSWSARSTGKVALKSSKISVSRVWNVALSRTIVRWGFVAEEQHERGLTPHAGETSLQVETCFRADFGYCVS